LTQVDKSNFRTLNNLGQKIRETREKQNLLLRQVAAFLEVDTAFISKAERGERNLQRDQVIKLAKLFNTPEDELIALWLSDKIVNIVEGDIYALQGIKKALNRYKQ
jgi:transcriptional regulator with XRE-family HTH domain